MKVTLICKKRKHEDKKWINYSLIRGGKWYSVKFVKDCAPPQIHRISEGVGRAFIELTQAHKFDVIETEPRVIFVESYGNLSAEDIQKGVDAETKRIEDYRAKREQEKINFLMPVDEAELPF